MNNTNNPSRSTVTLTPGQHTAIKMLAGQHYQVRKPGKPGKSGEPGDLQIPDNVIATRQGDALHLRYEDGSTVKFEDFYTVCKDVSVCSVNLVSDSEAGITLGANSTGTGMVSTDDGVLVYAHGEHDVLMSMARGQTQMNSAFTALGDVPVLTYLPQACLAAAAETTGGLALVSGFIIGHGTSGEPVGIAQNVVTGDIQAGPVIAGNDLKVNLYAADHSTLLAQNVKVDSTGHFSANVGSYTGVVFAQLLITGKGIADYTDEATLSQKDLTVPLQAMGVLQAHGTTLHLNLNLLSTVAANNAGPNPSATSSAVTSTGGSSAYSSTSDAVTVALNGVYTPNGGTILTTSGQREATNTEIGNFNGDGFMDYVDGNWVASNGMNVRLGKAAGVSATVDSNYTNSQTGSSKTSGTMLDFNGDGFADILVNDGSGSGSVSLFTGNAACTLGAATNTTSAWTATGLTGATAIGRSAGDFNGDGYQDMFVANGHGGAELIYGNASGSFTSYNAATASAGMAFTGTGTNATSFATYGPILNQNNVAAISYIGDSNRDGMADLAFANYLNGQVFVKFGTATQVATQAIDATTVAASTGKGFVVSGLSTTTASDAAARAQGVNVATAGDVNGDGYTDLLIMDPAAQAAYVIYGQASGSVADLNVTTMTSAQGFKIYATNAALLFATNGSGIGDVNGDGYGDIALSTTGLSAPGGVTVIFGGATGAHGNILANSVSSSSGWATPISLSNYTTLIHVGDNVGSTYGDINGDGLSDFSLSAGGNTDGGGIVVYGDTAINGRLLNPLLQGSAGTGTTAAERLLGTSGNDTLSGGGGADAISTGAGNDTVLIHDASFLRVDGGLGVDTLKLDATASAINLDFTANGLGGKIYGFENIDLTGGGNNSLKLTVQDVLAQGNTVDTAATAFNEAHLMVVSGNAGDTLTVANSASLNPGTWSAGTALSNSDRTALAALGYQFVAGDSYTTHSNGLATLIVDNAVTYQVL